MFLPFFMWNILAFGVLSGNNAQRGETMELESVKTLSVKGANLATGIGEHTIRAAIANDELAAIKLGQRRIRIRPQALERWLHSLEQAGAK